MFLGNFLKLNEISKNKKIPPCFKLWVNTVSHYYGNP